MTKTLSLLASILILQGCAAAFVAGTAGAVSAANDRRTLGAQIDDNNIEIKATYAVKSVDRLAKHANISIVSVNGIVLMVGQVANQEMKQEAENALSNVAGIRQLHNQLRIGTNIGATTKTHDTWLTSKVKTQLLTDEQVSGHSIKVVTENSEVFLMGLVNRDEANKAVDIARHVNGVERVIKAFEYL